jgi:hypothetical protein
MWKNAEYNMIIEKRYRHCHLQKNVIQNNNEDYLLITIKTAMSQKNQNTLKMKSLIMKVKKSKKRNYRNSNNNNSKSSLLKSQTKR